MDFFRAQISAVEQLVQTWHELFGRGGVQKANVGQRLFKVCQHARDLLGIRLIGGCHGVLHRESAQSHTPVVSNDLNGRTQIERAKLRIRGNRQRHMATVNVFVFHAKALRAKQKCHALLGRTGFRQLGKVLARRTCGWTKIARRHGGSAQVGHAIQRFVQCVDHPGLGQHIIGPAGPLNGFFFAQHIGPSRCHQHQLVKTHDLQGTGSSAHVASMAGLYQDKSRLHAPIVHAETPTETRDMRFMTPK